MTNKIDQLSSLIRAGWPGILVQSSEEPRVDRMVQQVAVSLGLAPTEWNLGYGWVRFRDKQPLSSAADDTRLATCLPALLDEDLDGKLVVIKSAALALDQDALAVARLRQLLGRIERHHRGRCAVVFLSELASLSPDIDPLVALLHLPLPSRAEIDAILEDFCTEHRLDTAPELRPMVVAACSGLSELELRTVLMTATGCGSQLDDATVDAIIDAKERIIAKGGALEMVAVRNDIADIGGLDTLKQWLQRRAEIVRRLGEAEAFGVKAPKGVLIAGMPGCGKSLTAKVAAGLFRLPLLRLDIGSLLGKYVGESEHNMRRALHMAETVSPCVLWVDELEKAFVGLGSGASEVSTRLLGYFLTWMQEKSAAVFVIATANDVTALPPELLRKGRFDEIFYVGFPNAEERAQILRIHLDKAGQPVQQFDLQALAVQCRDYTGADIESAINEALESAFIDGVPLTQTLLQQAIGATVPLRETLRDKVGQYEELFEKLKLKSASSAAGMSVARMIRQADDPNQVKREEVAAHPDCPDDLLEKMAVDGQFSVRKKVFLNPRCPESVLSVRINIDPEDPSYDDKLLKLACTHPNAPLDLLIRLIGEKRFPRALCNAIFQASPYPQKLWDEFRPRRSLIDSLSRSSFIWGGSPSAPKAEEPEVVEMVCSFAANRGLPEQLQDQLRSWMEGADVRRELACNPRLAEDVQRLLMQDEDREVRMNLVRNRGKANSVQLGLAEDEDVELRIALAGEDGLCEQAQCKLAVDATLAVRLALAESWHVADAAQCILIRDEDASVRQKMMDATTLGERAQMAAAKSPHTDTRIALASGWSRRLTEAALWELVEDPDPAVRTALMSWGMRDFPDAIRQHIAVNFELDARGAMMLYDFWQPNAMPEQVLRKFHDAKGMLGMQVQEAICKQSNLSRDFQLHLIASGDFMLDNNLTEAVFRLEPEVQAHLARSYMVDRARLAARPDLAPEIQFGLAGDDDQAVRDALRDNPCIEEETRRILAATD